MKTLVNKKLTGISTLLISLMLFTGCGKKNESGKRRSRSSSSSSLPTNNTGFNNNGFAGPAGIFNQVPCAGGFAGAQRIQVQSQAPYPGPPGAPRYGMTSNGDFVIANSNGGVVLLDIFLCPRTAFMDPMSGAPIQPQVRVNSYLPMESYGCSFQGLQADVTILSSLYGIEIPLYFREVGLTHPQLCSMQAI